MYIYILIWPLLLSCIQHIDLIKGSLFRRFACIMHFFLDTCISIGFLLVILISIMVNSSYYNFSFGNWKYRSCKAAHSMEEK